MQRNSLNLALLLAVSTMGTAWAAEPSAETAAVLAAEPEMAAGASGAGLTQVQGETVVVTASRMAQPLLDVDASMAVVSAEQARTMGVDNVPEMLREEPGVTLMSDGTPGVKRVALRGENPSRTLLMVDGQRIDDQKNKSGAPLLINPYFIERIEVVKGPSSVLYGSDALGGIVNVITKQAAEVPFEFDNLVYEREYILHVGYCYEEGSMADVFIFGPFTLIDPATGIEGIEASGEEEAGQPVYDLRGVRMPDGASLPKGIYIRGGKKFVVK